jgi:hypothetical protein
MVEYNSDVGNVWVPYPFSFNTFKKMAKSAGYKNIQLVNSISSSWMDEMYCAECYV